MQRFPGMDSGLYAAYTGLLARTQALDTAANNLANSGTNGFRAQRDFFSGVLANGLAAGQLGSQVGEGINNYGVLGGTVSDQGQGPMVPTANPLDVAISGSGFFAIQTKQGVRYTRDGSFSLSTTGQLQTAAGEPVLNGQLLPIQIPSGEVGISSDGTISVQSPAEGNAVVGQLPVFQFASNAALTLEGSNRYKAPADQTPVVATDAVLKQGAVEGSNEDAVHGTMQLVLIQRQAEMMQKALSVFNTDFDKTAVEQISRV